MASLLPPSSAPCHACIASADLRAYNNNKLEYRKKQAPASIWPELHQNWKCPDQGLIKGFFCSPFYTPYVQRYPGESGDNQPACPMQPCSHAPFFFESRVGHIKVSMTTLSFYTQQAPCCNGVTMSLEWIDHQRAQAHADGKMEYHDPFSSTPPPPGYSPPEVLEILTAIEAQLDRTPLTSPHEMTQIKQQLERAASHNAPSLHSECCSPISLPSMEDEISSLRARLRELELRSQGHPVEIKIENELPPPQPEQSVVAIEADDDTSNPPTPLEYRSSAQFPRSIAETTQRYPSVPTPLPPSRSPNPHQVHQYPTHVQQHIQPQQQAPPSPARIHPRPPHLILKQALPSLIPSPSPYTPRSFLPPPPASPYSPCTFAAQSLSPSLLSPASPLFPMPYRSVGAVGVPPPPPPPNPPRTPLTPCGNAHYLRNLPPLPGPPPPPHQQQQQQQSRQSPGPFNPTFPQHQVHHIQAPTQIPQSPQIPQVVSTQYPKQQQNYPHHRYHQDSGYFSPSISSSPAFPPPTTTTRDFDYGYGYGYGGVGGGEETGGDLNVNNGRRSRQSTPSPTNQVFVPVSVPGLPPPPPPPPPMMMMPFPQQHQQHQQQQQYNRRASTMMFGGFPGGKIESMVAVTDGSRATPPPPPPQQPPPYYFPPPPPA